MKTEWKYGRVLKSEVVANWKLSETTYVPETILSDHSHDFAYFCLVIRGDITESYGKHENLYRKSNLIFHPIGETHSNYFHTKSCCFNIQLSSENLSNVVLDQEVPNETAVFKGENINFLATRLYREFQSSDDFSHLTIEGLMLEIVAETLRNSFKNLSADCPKWLRQIKETLDEEFSDDLSVGSLAKSFDVHPTHLVRSFRHHFNVTIGDYVRRKRIDQAIEQIIGSQTPLSEIALAAQDFLIKATSRGSLRKQQA